MNFSAILTLIVVMTQQVASDSTCSPAQLAKHLLQSYKSEHRTALPVENCNETVILKFGVALIRIKEFDKKTGVGAFQVWLRYLWNDAHLKWNPQDFGGQGSIRLKPYSVWMPDIRLYNSLDDRLTIDYTNVVAYSNGDVLWIPPTTLRVKCESSGSNAHVCKFKFASWTYDGYSVDLSFYAEKEEIDLSDFEISEIPDSVRDTSRNEAEKHTIYYPCCEEPYPDLEFRITLHS